MNKVLSLGVGKQSSALYYMSSLGELPRVDYAIFADTGGEKTSTLEYYEHLLKWKKENNGIEIFKANYKNLENDLLNKTNSSNNRFASIPAFTKNDIGKKGMLRRQCTNEYKIAQVNKKYRELLGLGNKRFPTTEIWIGITLNEMERMVIPREQWKINVYPFCGYKVFHDGKTEKFSGYERSLVGVLSWYREKGYKIPKKSSCKFCPFQQDEAWIELKEESPNDFKDAVKIDYSIRDSSKKGFHNPIYLHDSLLPLDEVKFDTNQLKLWGNCTDACDV